MLKQPTILQNAQSSQVDRNCIGNMVGGLYCGLFKTCNKPWADSAFQTLQKYFGVNISFNLQLQIITGYVHETQNFFRLCFCITCTIKKKNIYIYLEETTSAQIQQNRLAKKILNKHEQMMFIQVFIKSSIYRQLYHHTKSLM